MTGSLRLVGAILLFSSAFTCAALAQTNTADSTQNSEIKVSSTMPLAAQASDRFDVDAATEAYLAMIPASAKARSDAYFEGGYWLILWDFLYGVVIYLLFLNLGWSAAMRNFAERMTRFKTLQTFIYWAQYLLAATILGAPLAIYEGYVRERQYGLATQTFGPWMGDQFKDLLVNLVLGGLVVMALFAIVRKLQKNWWIWGAVVSVAFLVIAVMIGPVFIQPIFNKITPLNDPKITRPVLSMAHANGIPVRDVYQIDASRQTTRMSANVSGFGKTMRITLNDNLLRRGSPEEIEAVMGHEMGHYVLNHISKHILFGLVVLVCFFGFLRWSLEGCLKRWGAKWQIRDVSDPAVLPLVMLLGSIFFFILTPVLNTHIRTTEGEADMFGVNASREPDGFAQAAIHLAEYRKMRPGPIEEYIFFDHPSGYNRIHRAMQWKAENLSLFHSASPVSSSAVVTPNPTGP
jgi:STE24 endopeptidase